MCRVRLLRVQPAVRAGVTWTVLLAMLSCALASSSPQPSCDTTATFRDSVVEAATQELEQEGFHLDKGEPRRMGHITELINVCTPSIVTLLISRDPAPISEQSASTLK